jgi:broad specificity phosphatase PhoE
VTILLARHGETDDNIEPIRIQGSLDTPLNDTGRAQAAELAERVAGEGIASLWSSQLSRARETAEIVAERLGMSPVTIDPRFAEGNRGELEGRLWVDVARDDPEL